MDWESEFFQRDRSIHPPALTPEYKTTVLRSPRQPLLSLQNSLSEVTGPLFGENELGPLDNDLILNYAKVGDAIGERIIVHGQSKDESGGLVPNTLSNSGRLMQADDTGTRTIATLRRLIRISAAAGGPSPTTTANTGFGLSSQVPIRSAITSTVGVPRTSIFPCSARASFNG